MNHSKTSSVSFIGVHVSKQQNYRYKFQIRQCRIADQDLIILNITKYIIKKGKTVADNMINVSFDLDNFVFFDVPPLVIKRLLLNNKLSS